MAIAEEDLFVTVDDAKSITGTEFTTDALYQAQILVELFANADFEDKANYGAKDVKWLSRAVAYEAVFLAENPGVLTNHSVSLLTQDQMSASLTSVAANVLSPAAIRCIENLSWRGDRTVVMGKLRKDFDNGTFTSLNEEQDEQHGWEPLNPDKIGF